MPKPQKKKSSSKDDQVTTQPDMPTQAVYTSEWPQWEEWVLEEAHHYYYRARHVSYDGFSTIGKNARNTTMIDGQGRCIHYQFMSIPEFDAAAQNYTQPAQPVYAQPVYAPPFNLAQFPPQVPENDDWESSHSGTSGEASDTERIVIIERTPDGVKIRLPESHSHGATRDKKPRKKPHSDKKKKVNSKDRVYTRM